MINNKSDSQQFWTTYSPGRRPWNRRINTLCCHLKNVLSINRNLDQYMLKNALFFWKSWNRVLWAGLEEWGRINNTLCSHLKHVSKQTVKKAGSEQWNHSLLILNGIQINTPSSPPPPRIGSHQNLSNEITLEYWRIGLQRRLPQWSQSGWCKSAQIQIW